jgi:hypothetical protein
MIKLVDINKVRKSRHYKGSNHPSHSAGPEYKSKGGSSGFSMGSRFIGGYSPYFPPNIEFEDEPSANEEPNDVETPSTP